MLYSGFGTRIGVIATLNDSIPMIIVAIAIIIPFTAKFWNIGGQGQYLVGSIFATWIGLDLAGSMPPAIVIMAALLLSFVGGALWAFPPTAMKLYFGTNEVITTLMMNFVAVYLVDYLVSGPMEGALQRATHAPSSSTIPSPDQLFYLHGVNIGIVIAIVIAVAIFFLIRYTNFGYELRLMGNSNIAAQYAGAPLKRNMFQAMLLSGGIAGIAGMVQVFGLAHALLLSELSDITTSFGYVAIPIALIAFLNPLLTVISAIFFAGILNGAYVLEVVYGISLNLVIIIYGLIMIFAIMGVMINLNRVTKLFRRGRKNKLVEAAKN
ncbi:MAG: ABC transporter permease [Nitrososphaerota archaeon]|jgi:simple sugar transport system permease protein|nr:ABC transporter permease [Nitrososphaerota archaeon]